MEDYVLFPVGTDRKRELELVKELEASWSWPVDGKSSAAEFYEYIISRIDTDANFWLTTKEGEVVSLFGAAPYPYIENSWETMGIIAEPFRGKSLSQWRLKLLSDCFNSLKNYFLFASISSRNLRSLASIRKLIPTFLPETAEVLFFEERREIEGVSPYNSHLFDLGQMQLSSFRSPDSFKEIILNEIRK